MTNPQLTLYQLLSSAWPSQGDKDNKMNCLTLLFFELIIEKLRHVGFSMSATNT
jgi:hypothetical protein